MLVRHPMERLVSCYFDKMVNGTHKSLRGFRRFVKMRAQTIRENRRDKINQKVGVYAPESAVLEGQNRPLGSYPKSNPWAGFGTRENTLAKNKKKKSSRIKRAAVKNVSKNNTKQNVEEFDLGLHDEKTVIPTFDDFLEFALTDLSGTFFKYYHFYSLKLTFKYCFRSRIFISLGAILADVHAMSF